MIVDRLYLTEKIDSTVSVVGRALLPVGILAASFWFNAKNQILAGAASKELFRDRYLIQTRSRMPILLVLDVAHANVVNAVVLENLGHDGFVLGGVELA